MTDWTTVRGSQADQPLEVEKNNGTVYLRKDITQVNMKNPDSEEVVSLWEYKEKQMTDSEYAQYQMVQESTNTIVNYQKQDTIDEYTEQLVEEGVI